MAQVQIIGEDLLIDGVAVMTFKPEVGYYEREQLKDWLAEVYAMQDLVSEERLDPDVD